MKYLGEKTMPDPRTGPDARAEWEACVGLQKIKNLSGEGLPE